MNLPQDEFWAMPVGMFLDMIDCYQIVSGNAKQAEAKENKSDGNDDDSIFDLK